MISFSEFLTEQQSSSILELSKVFGKNIVFSKEFSFFPNESVLTKIFDVLNTTLFNSKLDKIKICYWSKPEIVQFFKSNRQSFSASNLDFYGCCSSVARLYGLNGTEIEDIDSHTFQGTETLKIQPTALLLNSDKVQPNSIFIFVVSVLCHEMIHYYDMCFGDYPNMILGSMTTHQKYNSHTTSTFKHFMNEAQKQQVNVTSTDNGLDYSEFNLEAYRLLEDEKKPKVKLNYNEKTGKYDIDLMSLPFRDLGSIHIVDSNTMMITEFD